MNRLSSMNRRGEYRQALEESRRNLESLFNKREMLLLKQAQIEESVLYMDSLVKKEEELLRIASSTALQLGWARWNRDSRRGDLRAAQWQVLQNRLELGEFVGEDLALLLEKGTSNQ